MRGSISGMHDPYEDQLAAARYRAERDQAREELAKIKADCSWHACEAAGMMGAKEDRRAVAWVREHGGLESVEARLMPEGMEWPRYEGGGPVGIGSETDVLRVDEVRFGVGGTGGCTLYQVGPDGLNDRVQAVAAGGRVKRPDFQNSPKVYARLTSHSPAPAPKAADGAYFTHERSETDSYQQLYMDMAGRGKGNGIGFREFERRARALAGDA